ncbi:metal-dependent transcriptional regulator [bacterium]|nr:metal-dependent transcriptional regulator [bacterium]
MNKKLTESLETYLLAIDFLLEVKKTIIVKDVAQYLNFGGATTSNAIKKLKEKGYLNYEPYGNITLTSLGEKTVIIKKYRHNTIIKFLNKVLNIDKKNAEYNAKQMEYYMTDDVLERLVNFLDFMEQCSCSEPKWINSCKSSIETGELNKKCKSCSGGCCCFSK